MPAIIAQIECSSRFSYIKSCGRSAQGPGRSRGTNRQKDRQTDKLFPNYSIILVYVLFPTDWLIDWLSMVLRLRQHNIGYTADGFTGLMTQPTVSKHWRRVVSHPDRPQSNHAHWLKWVVLNISEKQSLLLSRVLEVCEGDNNKTQLQLLKYAEQRAYPPPHILSCHCRELG